MKNDGDCNNCQGHTETVDTEITQSKITLIFKLKEGHL